MDGFIGQAEAAPFRGCGPVDPRCRQSDEVDVMGYHDAREIPNYWTYAQQFVLQDHMFEPNFGWSLPAHLFMVSAWSARCSDPLDASTCRSDLVPNAVVPDTSSPSVPRFGWTDITYLLYTHHVSWGYYVAPGTQ